MEFKYDVIVIGAGHAGCEAAAAAANLGSKTCLITMDMNKIGQMSCNPAVGGIAKGQIVREIDALGGYMGLVTDKTAIQFRILNRSKGPAMWSPRAQCDRNKFIWAWREILENTPNLHIWQDTICEILVENGEVVGLTTLWGVTFRSKCVVLTAGTFLNGLMHVGHTMLPGGRMAEPASYQLTESIARHGITYGRMKTGTPVRIDGRSVHYEDMDIQDGENDFHKFSFMNNGVRHLKQLPCWTCFTNEEAHRILREGLPDSPLFNGQIQSIGPRYCPSIETKIVTFPDKEQHQLFLEPEGETTQELYLNGFSSSLPMNIQIEALKKYDVDKWFTEKVSAKDTNRPQLQAMIDFAREGDTIYIHDFSRLARSTADLLKLVEQLQAKGVHLVSNKENIDTSTPTGRLMLTMIGAINEFERCNLLERQREGIAIAKAQGKFKGRKEVKADDFAAQYQRYLNRELNKAQLAKTLGISRPTLDKMIRQHTAA